MVSENQIDQVFKNIDIKEFTDLYDRYAPSLYGMILKLTPDSSTATKVLEESFIRMWLERDSYNRSNSRLFTWMLGIALKYYTDNMLVSKKDLLHKLMVNGTKRSHHDPSSDYFIK